MVRVALQISAQLENIEKLETNHPEYSFFVKITCTNCGESSDKWHDITESERTLHHHDTRNPDGFNFYVKCKLCGRENTIDVVEKSNAPYGPESGLYKTIVVFDCRGVEPVEFSPRSGWLVKSAKNGQCFENVDLSEDWAEYDLKNKTSVGVYDFESKFIKLKK